MSLEAQPPLPAAPILTPPTGWLGLLGMKSSGVQPGLITPSVSPIQEMGKFYEAGQRQRLFFSANANIVANQFLATTSSNQVPSGNVWIVDSFIGLVQPLGAVAAARFALVILDPTQGFIKQAWPLQGPFLTGEAPFVVMPRPETPLVVLPGDFLTMYCCAPAAVTAVNANVTAYGCQVKA